MEKSALCVHVSADSLLNTAVRGQVLLCASWTGRTGRISQVDTARRIWGSLRERRAARDVRGAVPPEVQGVVLRQLALAPGGTV